MKINTKGAFGSCKTHVLHWEDDDIRHTTVLRTIICYKCGRASRFNKGNFPMPVVINKRKVGYLCKVCVKKAYARKQARKT